MYGRHLAPNIGGSELIQGNSTARMSQVALGYRNSPFSSHHTHSGSLHAGDRVPDIRVRYRAADGWAEAGLLTRLDPSRFTLLGAQSDETGVLDPDLRDAAGASGNLVTLVEPAPHAENPAKDAYEATLGRRSGVFLVRPDGRVGVATEENSAPRQLAAYRARWFEPEEASHAV